MDFLKIFKTIPIIVLFAHLAFADSAKLLQLDASQEFKMDSEKKQKIFYFWATWCPDCKEKFKSDLSKYDQNGRQLVTIPTDKDLQKIRDYVVKNNLKWPVAFDGEKFFQKQFKVFGVPTVVLAKLEDEKWIIEKTISGADWSELDKMLR